MVLHLIVLCLLILTGTAIVTGVLGRFWRFVMPRSTSRSPKQPLMKRLSLRPPGPDEFAEQLAVRARLDAPFAAIFLGFSLVVLATPGFDNAWVPMFLLWTLAAVVRWLENGPAASFARLGIVILLAVEALLVVGIHGATAFPQAGAYAVVALVGAVLLYRANELPISFGPRDPGGNLPPRRRPTGTARTRTRTSNSGAFVGHSLYDTLPGTQQQHSAQITPITRARRNPMRVREDEGRILTTPYYPQPSMQQAGGD